MIWLPIRGIFTYHTTNAICFHTKEKNVCSTASSLETNSFKFHVIMIVISRSDSLHFFIVLEEICLHFLVELWFSIPYWQKYWSPTYPMINLTFCDQALTHICQSLKRIFRLCFWFLNFFNRFNTFIWYPKFTFSLQYNLYSFLKMKTKRIGGFN